MFYTLTPLFFNFYDIEMEWIMTFNNVILFNLILDLESLICTPILTPAIS